jgi:hypothetical protein
VAWDTAANIINDAAVELGLYSTDLDNPYASTDANVVQLCRLLKSVGQDMVRDFQWTQLQKTYTFTTSSGLGTYPLPPDFARIIDQTAWDRTQQLPLGGPLAAQGWQYLRALVTSGVVGKWFRFIGGDLYLQPTPTAVETLAFEYISTDWVTPDGEGTPTAQTPTVGTDSLWLDRRLLVCAVKLAFKRAKGFDSMAAQEDYEKALARAQGADGAAPVLSLYGARRLSRVLDGANLPETGFGT